MRSHISDRTGDVRTFSRDCPEYYIELPSGRELLVLSNHFASKGSDASGRTPPRAVGGRGADVHIPNKALPTGGRCRRLQ